MTSPTTTQVPRRRSRPTAESTRSRSRAARRASRAARRASAIFADRGRWRRRLIVAGAVVAAAGAVAAVVWAFWFSSLLAVTSVRVIGVQGAAADSVMSTAHIPLGIPLARLDATGVAADVRAVPWIQSVEVRRGWPHDIVIAVQPKVALATLPSGRSVAADGSVYDPPPGAVPSPSSPAPADPSAIDGSVAVGSPARLPVVSAKGDALSEAMGVLASLPADLAARVKSLSAATRDSVDLDLRGGALVHWGSADKSTEKIQVLRSLLVHRADVYDVTAPELPTTWKRG